MAKLKQIVVDNFSYPFSGSHYLKIDAEGVIDANAAVTYGTTYGDETLVALPYLRNYVAAAIAAAGGSGGEGGQEISYTSPDNSITVDSTLKTLTINSDWISGAVKTFDWNGLLNNASKKVLSTLVTGWGFKTTDTKYTFDSTSLSTDLNTTPNTISVKSSYITNTILGIGTHSKGQVLKINNTNDGLQWGAAGIESVNLSDVSSDAATNSVIVVGNNGKLSASSETYLKSGDLYSSTKKLSVNNLSSATKPGYIKVDSNGNTTIVNQTYLTADNNLNVSKLTGSTAGFVTINSSNGVTIDSSTYVPSTQQAIYNIVKNIISKGTSHNKFTITNKDDTNQIVIADLGDGSGAGTTNYVYTWYSDSASISGNQDETAPTMGVKTDWLCGQIITNLSTTVAPAPSLPNVGDSKVLTIKKINNNTSGFVWADAGITSVNLSDVDAGTGNSSKLITVGTGTTLTTSTGNGFVKVANGVVSYDNSTYLTTAGLTQTNIYEAVAAIIQKGTSHSGFDITKNPTAKTITITDAGDGSGGGGKTEDNVSTSGTTTTIGVKTDWLTGRISNYLSTTVSTAGMSAGDSKVLKAEKDANGVVTYSWQDDLLAGGESFDGNNTISPATGDESITFFPATRTTKYTDQTIQVNTTWLAGWLNDNGYADTNDHMSTYMYVNTDWNGTGTPSNSASDQADPYIFLVEKYGSTNTKTNSIQIKAGTDISVKAKNGIITIGFTNSSGYQTTNTQYNLLVDKSQTTNGNVYIRLKDTAAAATTYVNSYKISGAQNVKVTSDSDGNITITGPDLTNYKTEDHDHTYSNGDTSLTFTPGSNETATVVVNTTWLEGFLTDNNYTINSDISGLVKEYLSGITGHAANKILKINSSNNDFEWVTPDSGGDITSTYLLSNVTGKGAGKVLKINSSNNGLVWANDEVGQSGSSDGNTTYSNGTGITLTGADADIDFGGNFSINTEWLDTYLNGKNYLTDHWVHYLKVNQGGANTIVGQQTSNTNTYLRLIENGSPVADKIQLSGGGTIGVSATSAGVITLSGKQYKLIVNDDLGTASKTNASNPYIILNQGGTNVNDKVRLSGGTNIDISNTLANNVNTITISFNNPGYITSYTQMSSYLRVNYNGTDTTSKSNTTTYKDVYIVLNQGGTNREDKIKLVGDDGVSISNSYDGTNKINTITITGPDLSDYKKDHLTANLWVGWNGSGTPANPATDVSNPCIILTEKEGSTYTIRDGIKLQGSGATTVKAKNGIVTINSTDYTYEDDNRLTQLTGANSNVFTIRPGANNQILSTTLVNSTLSAGWVNTPAWKTTDHDHTYSNGDTSLTFTPGSNETATVVINTTWLNTQIGNYITTNNIPTSDTNTRYKLVSVVSQDASTASKIPTIKLQSSTDGSTYSDQNTYKISGQNNVKVTSDSNGNIIIDGTHTHTFDHYNSYLYVGAKDGTANGTTNNTTDTYLLHVENGVNNSQVKLAGTNINISSNGGTLTLSGAAPYVVGSDNTKYQITTNGINLTNGLVSAVLSGSDNTSSYIPISGDGTYVKVTTDAKGNILVNGSHSHTVTHPSYTLNASNGDTVNDMKLTLRKDGTPVSNIKINTKNIKVGTYNTDDEQVIDLSAYQYDFTIASSFAQKHNSLSSMEQKPVENPLLALWQDTLNPDSSSDGWGMASQPIQFRGDGKYTKVIGTYKDDYEYPFEFQIIPSSIIDTAVSAFIADDGENSLSSINRRGSKGIPAVKTNTETDPNYVVNFNNNFGDTICPQFYLSTYTLNNNKHELFIHPVWFGQNLNEHLYTGSRADNLDSPFIHKQHRVSALVQGTPRVYDYYYDFSINSSWIIDSCVETAPVSSWVINNCVETQEVSTWFGTLPGRVGTYTGTTTIALNYNTGDFLTGAQITSKTNIQLTVSNIPAGKGILARFNFSAGGVGSKLRFGAANDDSSNILEVPEAGIYYAGFVRYGSFTGIQCIGVRKRLGIKTLS